MRFEVNTIKLLIKCSDHCMLNLDTFGINSVLIQNYISAQFELLSS